VSAPGLGVNLWSRTYDTLNRPAGLTYAEPGTFTAGYQYNNMPCGGADPANTNGAGNGRDLTTAWNTIGASNGYSFHYCYNDAHQLNYMWVDNLGAVPTGTGAPHTVQGGNWTYSFNTANQIQWINGPLPNGGPINFLGGNDPSGDVASVPGTASNTYLSFTYDHEGEGRMLSASVAQGSTTAYKYDAFGRRYMKISGGATTYYMHDFRGNVVEEYDNSTPRNLLRENVFDPAFTAPVAVVNYTGMPTSITVSFNHFDRQGSVMAVSAATIASPTSGPHWSGNGLLQSLYQYDPNGDSPPLVGTSFGYSGYRYDPETGLYHTQARYYDARRGQLLSPDPLGQGPGVNVYAYIGNDPLNNVDPSGLCPWCIFGAVVGAGLEAGVEYYHGDLSLSWASAGKIGVAAAAGFATGGVSTLAAAAGGSSLAVATVAGSFGSAASGASYVINSCAIDRACTAQGAAIALSAGALDAGGGGLAGDAVGKIANRLAGNATGTAFNAATQATASGLISGAGQDAANNALVPNPLAGYAGPANAPTGPGK
jgi:RHS repeat-associated protein